MPGYSSYHDYDPLGIAIDEARVGRNKLPVEQVESLYPDGMNLVYYLPGHCTFVENNF